MAVRVVIVEDQPQLLEAQVALLDDVPDLVVVGQALSGETGLELLRRHQPDVALVDLGLPGLDGVELTRRARAVCPKTEVVVHTIFEDGERARAAIAAGAAGYILKGLPADQLAAAILAVHRGGAVVTPSVARPLLDGLRRPLPAPAAPPDEPGPPLSAREIDVLQLAAKGLPDHEIAQVLGVRRSTVRTHLHHLFDKLDASNRVEAVTEGYRRGIIHP